MAGKVISRFVAFILAGLVIVLLPIAMWVSAAQAAFLNADTYKNGLDEQNIYGDIADAALPMISREITTPQGEPFIQLITDLDDDKRRQVISELLPAAWVQEQLDMGLDRFFGWLNGDGTTLDRGLDLSELQGRLRGQEGARAVDIILSDVPPCNDQQITQIENFANGSTDIPVCMPPPASEGTLRDIMRQAMSSFADSIDQRSPSFQRMVGFTPNNDGQSLPIFIEASQHMLAVFYLCPAALLSLIVVFVVRSLRTFGRWTGWIGIASAFIAILPLPLLSGGIISSVTAEITQSPQSAEVQLFQIRLFTGLISSGFAQFSVPVVAQALLIVLIAAFLLIVPPMVTKRPLPVPTLMEDMPTMMTASGRLGSTGTPRPTGQVSKTEE